MKDVIDIPSLHIIGKNDSIVSNDRTVELAHQFKDASVMYHEGG